MVQIGEDEANMNVSTAEVVFEEGQKSITIDITITSQDGEHTFTKPLEIYRIAQDNTIESIYAGEEENEELVTEYDSAKSQYTAYVLKTKEIEYFKIKATSEYATIKCNGITGQGRIEVSIDVRL